MRAQGHFGLALLASSLALWAAGVDPVSQSGVALTGAAVASCMLPDLDLPVGLRHRAYTHSLLWALLLGAAGLLASPCCPVWVGAGLALGYGSHVAGDLLTYRKFPPLWPLCGCRVSLGLFRADSRAANSLLLFLGVAAYTYLAASPAIHAALLRNISIPLG